MKLRICPCCGNGCKENNLNCGRGRAYFEGKRKEELAKKNESDENIQIEFK